MNELLFKMSSLTSKGQTSPQNCELRFTYPDPVSSPMCWPTHCLLMRDFKHTMKSTFEDKRKQAYVINLKICNVHQQTQIIHKHKSLLTCDKQTYAHIVWSLTNAMHSWQSKSTCIHYATCVFPPASFTLFSNIFCPMQILLAWKASSHFNRFRQWVTLSWYRVQMACWLHWRIEMSHCVFQHWLVMAITQEVLVLAYLMMNTIFIGMLKLCLITYDWWQ